MPACFCINSLGHGVTQVAWRCTGVMVLHGSHGVAPVAWRCTGVMVLHGSHGVVRVAWRCTDDMPVTGHEPNLSAGVWNGWELALPRESGTDRD